MKMIRLFIVALVLIGSCAACVGLGRPGPGAFAVPVESRLVLQVPFLADDVVPCSASALAAVMTFNGQPTTMEKAALALESAENREKGRAMVLWARQESTKASFYGGTPEQLVDAVKAQKPVILRLDRETGPVAAGNYAVLVGYTPDGPVLNSCDVNQQIVPWSDFLASWHKADNLMMMIEPL